MRPTLELVIPLYSGRKNKVTVVFLSWGKEQIQEDIVKTLEIGSLSLQTQNRSYLWVKKSVSTSGLLTKAQ